MPLLELGVNAAISRLTQTAIKAGSEIVRVAINPSPQVSSIWGVEEAD
jgi:hypothetical protein